MVNEEIARGMVCFFHQKKHSYLINYCGFLVVLLSFAMFCGHLVYFSDLGKLYQHTKKNLATLVSDGANQGKSKAKPNDKRAHTHSYISTYVCI
jgi:hypothetical protein